MTIRADIKLLSPDVTMTHKGIYGVIKQNNQILVIKKARGPYTGLYDLPGGSPEMGETELQTVVREIKEETNCEAVSCEKLTTTTILFSDFTKEYGQTGVLQHTGSLYRVDVSGTPSAAGDGLDSNGALWMDISELSKQNATPFVLMAIDLTK